MTVPAATSPDCETKKHTACSGDAWDFLTDEAAPCTCSCHRRPLKTSAQPLQDVVSRYRPPGGGLIAVLICEHEEPCSDLPMATRLRCTTCLPVRRPDAPKLALPRDAYGRPS